MRGGGGWRRGSGSVGVGVFVVVGGDGSDIIVGGCDVGSGGGVDGDCGGRGDYGGGSGGGVDGGSSGDGGVGVGGDLANVVVRMVVRVNCFGVDCCW